jgi:hypothetical protein
LYYRYASFVKDDEALKANSHLDTATICMLRRLFAMAENVAVKRMKTSAPLIGTHKSALINQTLRRNSADLMAFIAGISMPMRP